MICLEKNNKSLKAVSIFIILFLPIVALGQKFMIQGKDTLPYNEKMVIQKNTTHLQNKTSYSGDTIYEGACRTFEKIHGQIVNQTDSLCQSFGIWIITDSLGNYWSGLYKDGYKTGVWKRFDKSGRLLREKEDVHLNKNIYTIKDIDYTSSQPQTIISKPFVGFYLKHFTIIIALIFIAFFSRMFINSSIYNIENNTDFSLISFIFPGIVPKNFTHVLLCTFTLWFSNYKPQNKRLVIISNVLSLIVIGIFILIGVVVEMDGGL